MYSTEREIYYKKLLSIYRIPVEWIIGRYNNEVVYIDTDNRMMYNSMGQTVLQFRH
jgi:hypothetical protein